MSLQRKKSAQIYNYNNVPLGLIEEDAIDIKVTERLDNLNQLEIIFPRYQFEGGILVTDENDDPVINPKVNFFINDNKILYDGTWYIIRTNYDIFDDDEKKYVSIECYEIGYELTRKYVQYLDISPPVKDAQNVQNTFEQILESAQQLRDGFVVSSTINTCVLDINAHPSNGFYDGYKIKITSGTGVNQERTITSYVGSSKTATIDSNWITNPDTTSVFRIYNDVWTVGTIDPVFLTNGGLPILRGHRFDYNTALEALIRAKNQYIDDVTNLSGYITFSSSYNNTTNRWENQVNLVQGNGYSGIDIRYEKNMRGITRKIESENVATRMTFTGNDNLTIAPRPNSTRTDSGVTYFEHISGHNDLYNFQYYLAQGYTEKQCFDRFIFDYHFEDSRYVLVDDMFNDGKELLNRLSVPEVTYVVSMKDLSRALGGEIQEEFNIGDTLKIFNADLGVDVLATVTEKQQSEADPENVSLELNNYIERTGDLLSRIINRGDINLEKDKISGQSTTIVISDMMTTKNWRQARYIVQPTEFLNDIINRIILDLQTKGLGGSIVLLDGTFKTNGAINYAEDIAIFGQGEGITIIEHDAPFIDLLSSASVNNLEFSDIEVRSSSNLITSTLCDFIAMRNVTYNSTQNIASGDVGYFLSCKNIQISNFKINLSSTFTTDNVLRIDRGENVTISNIAAENTKGGIGIEASSEDGSVIRVEGVRIRSSGLDENNSASGLSIVATSVTPNPLDNLGSHGKIIIDDIDISSDGNPYRLVAGVRDVLNVSISKVKSSNAGWQTGIQLVDSYNVEIENCNLINYGTNSNPAQIGNRGGIVISGGDKIKAQGNTLTTNATDNLPTYSVFGILNSSDNSIITGNELKNAAPQAINRLNDVGTNNTVANNKTT